MLSLSAQRLLRPWCLVLAVIVLAGCSKETIRRIRVQGVVTYEGKPVHFGALAMEPTASVGGIAPSVFVGVREGSYDTGPKGPVAGKYVITVSGRGEQQPVDGDGVSRWNKLFPPYKFEVVFPPPGNRLDIEVPKPTEVSGEANNGEVPQP